MTAAPASTSPEDEEQLDKVLEVRERTPTLEKIIIFDMEGLRNFSDPQCMSYAELIARGAAYGEGHEADWQAGDRCGRTG